MGWDLSLVPTEQIILPKWEAFSVVPYSWLGWPCYAKSPSAEFVLKAKVSLPDPAKLLMASAPCHPHSCPEVPTLPAWLTPGLHQDLSSLISHTAQVSLCNLTSTWNDLASALDEETWACRRSIASIDHLSPFSSWPGGMEIFTSCNTVSVEQGMSMAKAKDGLLWAGFAAWRSCGRGTSRQPLLWDPHCPGGAISPACPPASPLPWGWPWQWDLVEPEKHLKMQT